MNLFLTKSPHTQPHSELHRCLSALDLMLLGVGVIVGAGIFVLTGIAAATKAGPAITLSYVVSGVACLFAALSYAELASSVGGSGSAYNYAYASMGEIIAWLIGWAMILEYAVGTCIVANGWSGYVNNALTAFGVDFPEMLQKGPLEGGWVNLPALLIVLFLSLLLVLGVKQSAKMNALIVSIKLIVITLFIITAVPHVNFDYWKVFMPFGWTGVMQGAALVFFAYIGFDSVSTAAEEAKNPQRDLSIGIIGSLAVCVIIYIVVSGLLTLVTPYATLNVKSPVAEVLLKLNHRFVAELIAIGVIAGITSVMLVFIFSLSRILYAISRDGLLPPFFSKIHPKTKTPSRTVLYAGTLIALMAGVLPLKTMAELVNIGTLSAFIIVCTGVIILRIKHPELPRPFKTPFSPWVPLCGIFFCGYLMISLSFHTWIRFLIWMSIGLVIYFRYGYHHSKLRHKI